MKWTLLKKSPMADFFRGSLFMFDAIDPFEEKVIMMLIEYKHLHNSLGLVCVTGYKAGLAPYVIFPDTVTQKKAGGLSVDAKWLIDNWLTWVMPSTNLDNIFVAEAGVSVSDFCCPVCPVPPSQQ